MPKAPVCFLALGAAMLLAGCGTVAIPLTASPTLPTANIGGPYTGTVGVAVSFNGSGSSDPLGQALSYAWAFGDGGTATGSKPTHTYTAPGNYTVSLTVTDTSNLSSPISTTTAAISVVTGRSM